MMPELADALRSVFATGRLPLSNDSSFCPVLSPALFLLYTLAFVYASACSVAIQVYQHFSSDPQRAHKAMASYLSSFLLCVLLGLRRHPLAYVGLAAPLPSSLVDRVAVAALVTPFVRLEAALRPLAGRLDAALPAPAWAPSPGCPSSKTLWLWWRPVRVAMRQLVICGAALALDIAFGSALSELATAQAARAIAIACGAEVGDPYFEALHLAFGVVEAVEPSLPREAVFDLSKFVCQAIDLGPYSCSHGGQRRSQPQPFVDRH
ncbi:unnamed protein product [Cutaneotrichosporon oleaginosum]